MAAASGPSRWWWMAGFLFSQEGCGGGGSPNFFCEAGVVVER